MGVPFKGGKSQASNDAEKVVEETEEIHVDEREGGEQEEEEDWDAHPQAESYLDVLRRRFPHVYRDRA